MPQFTVHRNKNARTKATFPFLLDVQSDLLEDLETRVVIPLSKITTLTKKPVTHLMPILDFQGDAYVLVTPQLAGIPRGELGAAAGSVVDQRNLIIGAMDFLLTGL